MPFFVGSTTSDLVVPEDDDAKPAFDESPAAAAGESERFLDVVGRPFPFFLKNGTLTGSPADAMVGVDKEIRSC